MPKYDQPLRHTDGELATVHGYFARHYKGHGATFSFSEALFRTNRTEGTRSIYIRTSSGNTYYLDIFSGLIISLKESLQRGQIVARPINHIDPNITCGRGFTYEALEMNADGAPIAGIRAHTSHVEEIVTIEDGPTATFGIAPDEEQEISFVRDFDEARRRLLPDRAEWV